MFERFTDRARHVVVLAQVEARRLNHAYIGTEHLLLGLLAAQGVAAHALASLGAVVGDVRREIESRIGIGSTPPAGHIPFTPPAKRVLELSLQECVRADRHDISTGELLLGLVRERDGVAAQVLSDMVGDLQALRAAVDEAIAAGADEGEPPVDIQEVRTTLHQSATAMAVRPPDPSAMPLCPVCHGKLDGALGYRVLEAEEFEGSKRRRIFFVYCKTCGLPIDNWMAPEGG